MKLSFSLIALVAANSLSMNREGALLEGKDSVELNAVPASYVNRVRRDDHENDDTVADEVMEPENDAEVDDASADDNNDHDEDHNEDHDENHDEDHDEDHNEDHDKDKADKDKADKDHSNEDHDDKEGDAAATTLSMMLMFTVPYMLD